MVPDLGPRARVGFTVLYLTAQITLISFGIRSPDVVFAFQMFNEASSIRVSLFRRVGGREELVPVSDRAWRAHDAAGVVHEFRWDDRVRYEGLTRLDAWVHASYGLEAQLFRLQGALDDVVRHIPGDAETVALVAVVEANRNGRPAVPRRLVGVRP